jgi:hypothetical protein
LPGGLVTALEAETGRTLLKDRRRDAEAVCFLKERSDGMIEPRLAKGRVSAHRGTVAARHDQAAGQHQSPGNVQHGFGLADFLGIERVRGCGAGVCDDRVGKSPQGRHQLVRRVHVRADDRISFASAR